MKVVNDIAGILDNKRCAPLLIDVSKAFDTVDHHILKQRLVSIGICSGVVCELPL